MSGQNASRIGQQYQLSQIERVATSPTTRTIHPGSRAAMIPLPHSVLKAVQHDLRRDAGEIQFMWHIAWGANFVWTADGSKYIALGLPWSLA